MQKRGKQRNPQPLGKARLATNEYDASAVLP